MGESVYNGDTPPSWNERMCTTVINLSSREGRNVCTTLTFSSHPWEKQGITGTETRYRKGCCTRRIIPVEEREEGLMS